jgi:hypothetical protein
MEYNILSINFATTDTVNELPTMLRAAASVTLTGIDRRPGGIPWSRKYSDNVKNLLLEKQ